MAIKKYLDWRGYFEGLYLNWIKTVTTTFLTFIGTNAAEQMGVKGIGLDVKQAGSMLLVITAIEVLKYLQTKPKPEIITEEVNTELITKPKE